MNRLRATIIEIHLILDTLSAREIAKRGEKGNAFLNWPTEMTGMISISQGLIHLLIWVNSECCTVKIQHSLAPTYTQKSKNNNGEEKSKLVFPFHIQYLKVWGWENRARGKTFRIETSIPRAKIILYPQCTLLTRVPQIKSFISFLHEESTVFCFR